MGSDEENVSPGSDINRKYGDEEEGRKEAKNVRAKFGSNQERKSTDSRNRSKSPTGKTTSDYKKDHQHVSRETNKNDPESVRCRMFIGNLNTDKISCEEVEKHFSKFGKIVGCSLHTNFGFVQYDTREEADLAVKETHGTILFGKRVDANIASERRRPAGKSRKGDRPGREEYRDGHERYRSRSPVPRYDEFYESDERKGRNRGDSQTDPYYKEMQRTTSSHTKDYECEIIAASPDVSTYCESIEARLQPMGISARMMFPPPDLSIADIINRLAKTGCLYAVVVASQNKYHQSCTLNILHGAAQEHRNMPLDDALAFLARHFNQYLIDLKERRPNRWSAQNEFSAQDQFSGKNILMQDSYISGLLNLAASGRSLKVVEVNHLIEALIKYKNEIDGASAGESGETYASGHYPGIAESQVASSVTVPASASEVKHSTISNDYYSHYAYGNSLLGSASTPE